LNNGGKVAHPFKITDGYVKFLAVVGYLFSMPYRQLESFTKIHFAVDVRMREVVAMDVTTELMASMTLRFRRA